jgi:hypothetical protein
MHRSASNVFPPISQKNGTSAQKPGVLDVRRLTHLHWSASSVLPRSSQNDGVNAQVPGSTI